jgi:hypothetical protein
MRTTTTFPSRSLAMFVLSVCLASATASERASKPKALQLDWELAISAGREQQSRQLPERILRTDTDELVAVGNRIVPLSRRGPGEIARIDTKALVLDAALDSQGNIWVGGRVNQRAWFPGADMADAYLGRFSRNGEKQAEFHFGNRSWWQIVALHPRRDGGVLVTGPRQSSRGSGTWLASVSREGKISWEKTIGLSANAAISEGRDGNVAFVGLRNVDSATHTGEEEAVFWLFDPQGKVLAEHVIRPSINAHRSARYESVAMEAAPDGYFALVAWGDPSDDKPLTVAKLSLSGAVEWNVPLKHTATARPGRSADWEKCDQKQAVLGNGDLLVACSVEGEIILSRLDGKSGTQKTQRAALPACHEKRPAVITPFPLGKNSVLLVGSRPSSNVAASCSWLAELRLEP